MFWDNVAGAYDIFVNVINRKTHQKLKRIVSSLIEPDNTVLECACGTGLLSAVIAPKCRQLTATDYSEKMLNKAKKNCAVFQNITFSKADITALSYPDGSFDTRMCPNVDFCRANGYEEFLPAICAQDHKIASAMHGILIRTHTIARGDDYCDWWYFGDKQELPEEAKNRLKVQETDRTVSSIV